MFRFFLSILFALTFSISSISSVAFAATYRATITKITDGDTVWVRMHGSRVKLRLLGIDTPEEYYSKKMLKDVRMCDTSYNQMKQLGLSATRHTRTMLHREQKVTIETFGRGYYGRTLAYVILPNGINYNEKEVADGYAVVYTYHGQKSREISQNEFSKLNSLMDQAKIEHKGLWGSDPQIMSCLDGSSEVIAPKQSPSYNQPAMTKQSELPQPIVRPAPTATCRDGTYSYSMHHRGTCSHHGGVESFYQ